MSFWNPVALIATWFGSGLLPIGPGTWGSAAALPFGFAIMALGGPYLLLAFIAAVFVLGWWASGEFIKGIKDGDPPEVVVDEVVAQWLVLTVTPMSLYGYLVAFLIFRFFDTAKIWPANWVDREMDGAAGIMLDDLIAGMYATLAMIVIVYFEIL